VQWAKITAWFTRSADPTPKIEQGAVELSVRTGGAGEPVKV
jgi:hypothetical protein